ncbi:hypothetical protein FW781_16780 [Chryseobacterium panacisoli]|uniref:Uncharacterized protein n=1 Tax=Chryseobacterium panacisoli TaxID=1807141 RepID=A0A5D8ZJR1_9FLAO|nr:hypothetical protein [Chryseobacterium panacisoli]TZF94272.1 hypothetical protein FW781_16780 [Chryseobacterium panacisoli]
MIPFLKKLTPKDKKEVVALLKKYNNKKLSHNTISVWASLFCCKAGNEYKDKSGYVIIPAYFVDEFFENHLPENTSFLNNLFNSYHSVYHNGLIKILYEKVCFSDSFFSMKSNEILSGAVYQYNTEEEISLPDVWMKLDLSSLQEPYLFLFLELFNKYETLSGTAFEALLNKMVSDDFKKQRLEISIGKKVSFEWTKVKRFTERFLKLINLINNCNIAFRKLLIPILSAVEKSVFNVKKPPELCYG